MKRGDFFPTVDNSRDFYGDLLTRRDTDTDAVGEVDDPMPEGIDYYT
jgi:hypothetical protein